MVDLAKLVVRLEAENSKLTRALEKSGRDLNKFETQAKKSFNSLKGIFKTGLFAVGAGLSADLFITTIRSGEKLQASLETATGSVDAAGVAFRELERFAATTPYSLDQVTDSFIKLKNFGLDPGISALTSYGNTASALGKPLNQVIEAVADAATFEFERLKEFGIKARQQAGTVTFVFQGVSTTVRKNATDIENYLKRLGDVNFAGAMERQASTLDGALSNLGDSFASLIREIGNAGLADVLSTLARRTAGFADAIDDLVEGNGAELPEWMKFVGFAGKAAGLGIQTLIEMLRAASGATAAFVSGNETLLEYIQDDFRQFVANQDDALQEYVDKLNGLSTQVRTQTTDPFEKIGGDSDRGTSEIEKQNKKKRQSFVEVTNAIRLQSESIRAGNLALERQNETITDELEITRAIAQAREDVGRSLSSSEEQVIEELTREKQALRDHAVELKRVEDVYREIRNPADELTQKFADLNTLLEQGRISWDTYADAVFEAQDSLENVSLDQTVKELGDGAKELGLIFESSFEQAIIEGEKFRDVLKGIGKDILQIIARQVVTKPLGDFVTAGISSLIPGFASGTNFAPGGLAMVGEDGPELVNLPRGSKVYPTGEGIGGISISVDARGSTDPLATEQAVKRAVKASISAIRDMKMRNKLPEFA